MQIIYYQKLYPLIHIFENMHENMNVADPITLTSLIIEQKSIYSEYLERNVIFDCYLPLNLSYPDHINLLLVNDGQDLPKMNFGELLDTLQQSGKIDRVMCVGIYCGPERVMEYGTICQPNYAGKGAKAGLYQKFIFDELLPFIRKQYHIPSFKEKSFAGFSLGGLSALDIVWNNATEFSKVGVFSGSLWWRRKGYNEGYNDEKDRIMHLQVQKGKFYPWLRFFFECGQLDETADRNNNGIIDSIDDTLDMVVTLKSKGYTDDHIKYLELADGKHDVETWGKAFPKFLQWGWGKGI